MQTFRQIAGHDQRYSVGVLYSILAVYGTTVIVSFHRYVPTWDGWAFYRDCFMHFATTGECSCFGHAAEFPTVLYGTVAYIFPYNLTAFALVNFAMGLAACYSLGRAISHIVPAKPWLCHAATSILILNPVMFAQAIQPSLDYSLAVLCAFLIAAFLSDEMVIAVIVGLLMTLTKELGIVLYCILLGCHTLITLEGEVRAGNIKRASRYLATHSYMLLPPILFVVYSALLGLHGASFGRQSVSLRDAAEMLLVLFPDKDLMIAQLGSLFVLNLNWVLSAGLIGSLLAAGCRRRLFDSDVVKWLTIISISLAAGTYIHTRVLLWNNPRYILPLFAFLLTGFAIGLSQLSVRHPRLVVGTLLIYVPTLIASQFFTIDPVSKLTYGTINFGAHEMLSSGGFRRLPEHAGYSYVGRDQLVYNFQFIKFSDLAEKAVRIFGLDAHYVTGPVFTGWVDYQGYDERTMTRSMDPNARQIDFSNFNDELSALDCGSEPAFVYLEFPNVLNDGPLEFLKERYQLLAVHVISSESGYSIRAYEFTPKVGPPVDVGRSSGGNGVVRGNVESGTD